MNLVRKILFFCAYFVHVQEVVGGRSEGRPRTAALQASPPTRNRRGPVNAGEGGSTRWAVVLLSSWTATWNPSGIVTPVSDEIVAFGSARRRARKSPSSAALT